MEPGQPAQQFNGVRCTQIGLGPRGNSLTEKRPVPSSGTPIRWDDIWVIYSQNGVTVNFQCTILTCPPMSLGRYWVKFGTWLKEKNRLRSTVEYTLPHGMRPVSYALTENRSVSLIQKHTCDNHAIPRQETKLQLPTHTELEANWNKIQSLQHLSTVVL